MTMTMSNSIYASLKRKGLHNWGFFNIKHDDFDFNEVDLDALDFQDMDLYLFDLEE